MFRLNRPENATPLVAQNMTEKTFREMSSATVRDFQCIEVETPNVLRDVLRDVLASFGKKLDYRAKVNTPASNTVRQNSGGK